MKNILATTSSFAKGSPERLERVRQHSLEVILNPWGRKLNEAELLEMLERYQPIGLLAGTEPITAKILHSAKPYLKTVSRVGVGWDNVDRKAAAELGILVYRTHGVLTEAVSELTLGLILSALRAIALTDRQIRQGNWQKPMGRLLYKKTVGVIGFGTIGMRVGELVRAFGAEVIYHDPQPPNVSWAQAVPLQTLLAQADIITLHASGKERLLGRGELESIAKPGVILVNTARGELVDEEVLHDFLKEGRLGFAALDVFAKEPYCGPLCILDNVVLTSHIGSYAFEARQRMEDEAIANLLLGLREVKAI